MHKTLQAIWYWPKRRDCSIGWKSMFVGDESKLNVRRTILGKSGGPQKGNSCPWTCTYFMGKGNRQLINHKMLHCYVTWLTWSTFKLGTLLVIIVSSWESRFAASPDKRRHWWVNTIIMQHSLNQSPNREGGSDVEVQECWLPPPSEERKLMTTLGSTELPTADELEGCTKRLASTVLSFKY